MDREEQQHLYSRAQSTACKDDKPVRGECWTNSWTATKDKSEGGTKTLERWPLQARCPMAARCRR